MSNMLNTTISGPHDVNFLLYASRKYEYIITAVLEFILLVEPCM